MRKSEITDELIALSKKAKELGFPQDVENGDYIQHGNETKLVLCEVDANLGELREPCCIDWKHHISTLSNQEDWFLILSFSTCLAWLREKGYLYFDCLNHPDGTWSGIVAHPPKGKEDFVIKPSSSHHELGAKAVIKVLEVNDD